MTRSGRPFPLRMRMPPTRTSNPLPLPLALRRLALDVARRRLRARRWVDPVRGAERARKVVYQLAKRKWSVRICAT